MEDDKFSILSEVFFDLGGPGSFQGPFKLRKALEAKGHKFSDEDIENFLLKTKSYFQYRQKYRTAIPRHTSLRFSLVSGPDIQWFADSAYFPTGWFGPFRFAQVKRSLRRHFS